MRIFAEAELRDLLNERDARLEREVMSEDKNKLLNMNETAYVEYLLAKYHVDPLVFDWDNRSLSEREERITAERFPWDFHVIQGKSYPKQVITYHVPLSGEIELLRRTPTGRILWTSEVRIAGNQMQFDVINWRDDPEVIKREADEISSHIQTQAANVCREVNEFNSALDDKVNKVVRDRKETLLRQANIVAS